MDNLTKEQRHKNMSHIRSHDTKPEILLRHTLWQYGLRYRKNDTRLPGKPDIVISRYRIAIFVDGDFFHGRDMAKIDNQVKSNREYWISKIKRNKERDKQINEELTEEGWIVLRFWEHDIKKNLQDCIQQIFYYIPYQE